MHLSAIVAPHVLAMAIAACRTTHSQPGFRAGLHKRAWRSVSVQCTGSATATGQMTGAAAASKTQSRMPTTSCPMPGTRASTSWTQQVVTCGAHLGEMWVTLPRPEMQGVHGSPAAPSGGRWWWCWRGGGLPAWEVVTPRRVLPAPAPVTTHPPPPVLQRSTQCRPPRQPRAAPTCTSPAGCAAGGGRTLYWPPSSQAMAGRPTFGTTAACRVWMRRTSGRAWRRA